jgi:hypothetical protein
MTTWYCNNGDGLTTGYWAIAPWKRATSYPANSIVRQQGGVITIGVALDITNSKIYFIDLTNNGQWNDSATANPATNTGGTTVSVTGALFPVLTVWSLSSATANFGASAFVGTVPSGFSSVNTQAGSTVTWNPSDADSSIVFSNGNLTAVAGGSVSVQRSVRATSSFSAGKIYYEVTIGWVTAAVGNTGARSPVAEPLWAFGYANATMTTAQWAGDNTNSIAYSSNAGAIRYNNANVTTLHVLNAVTSGNERVFKNKSGSTITSGATQPSWNLGSGATTSDNGGTWTEVTGTATDGWNTSWARLETLSTGRMSAGDTVLVGDNHAQAIQGINSVSFASAVGYFVSVNHAVSSPGSGDLLAGAALYFNNSIATLSGGINLVGFSIVNQGLTNGTVALGGSADGQRYDNCTLSHTNTTSLSCFILGSTGTGIAGYLEFNNSTVVQSGSPIAQPLRVGGARTVWRGGSATTVSSFELFQSASGSQGSEVTFDGTDFSAVTGNLCPAALPASATFMLSRCKLPSSTFLSIQFSSGPGSPEICYFGCSNTTDQESFGLMNGLAKSNDDKTVIRTGGASDGVNGYSYKIVTGTGPSYAASFAGVPMEMWNSTTAATRTLTLYGVVNAATLPTSADIWPEVRYLGSSSSLLGSLASGGIANILASGTNWTADTISTWDSKATARANTTAYNVGDVVKTASNPGRIFFCTGAGTSAGSEPGGFAAAADGTSSITDGTATFRAGYRFSMSVTLSAPQPQLAGLITTLIKVAKASTTYYIDPPVPASLA